MGYTFSKDLLPKVTDGSKTQTRRPYKSGDHVRDEYCSAVYRDGRKKWQVGQRYAVVPGRGKKGVGHIEVTRLRYDGDVRNISEADAIAEGFETPMDFVATWCGFYDEDVRLEKLSKGRWSLLIVNSGKRIDVIASAAQVLELIKKHRPEKLYRAWVTEFVLVTEQVAS